ncbi:MBL fold metallo-hydrolase RNA specificity domain-containing protein [Inhella sp.]|uniref:MBL fold metallo-hydrolase RNA specificity domain-containing protein n=1 Tax=Inhella sp. TaxID=1921806 RepID=UPI0035AED642
MKISFLGAAQEVTGSCYLIEAGGARFLVDCGMHQGGREQAARNHQPWPFDPAGIDFVLLTHAHIDHSGLLPRLVAMGFKGPIFCTRATADLLGVMLLDSAHIQESSWARMQRRRQRGRPVQETRLLYTVRQAEESLKQLQGVGYGDSLQAHPAVRVRFQDAGHILGSASLEIWLSEGARTRKLVVSGDLGQPGRPIVRDPVAIHEADVLLIESTYGNRLHRPMTDTVEELVQVVDETLARGKGNLIVPAFALGRTQELLLLLTQLVREGRLPRLRVFVDSPMADRVTQLTWKHFDYLDDETRALLAARGVQAKWLDLRFTQSVEESMALNRIHSGAIILAASGMCDAGRIQHHLRHHLGHAGSAVAIVGYQAEGTLGRRLVDGAKQVRVLGDDVRVRARIHTIGGLSAHADQAALLAWCGHFKKSPAQTFVVHGEAQTAQGFAALLHQKLGWTAKAPLAGSVFSL